MSFPLFSYENVFIIKMGQKLKEQKFSPKLLLLLEANVLEKVANCTFATVISSPAVRIEILNCRKIKGTESHSPNFKAAVGFPKMLADHISRTL